MDLRYIFSYGITIILVLTISVCNTEDAAKSAPLIGRVLLRTPSAPVYVQQPRVYYYYPQAQYPQPGVVYTPTVNTVGQYPYYGWSNTPAYNPNTPVYNPNTPTYNPAAVPTTPAVSNGGGVVGDPNNPKNDVEYIY